MKRMTDRKAVRMRGLTPGLVALLGAACEPRSEAVAPVAVALAAEVPSISTGIAGGMRAVSVPFADADLLRPGDRIDLLGVLEDPEAGGLTAWTLVQGAAVLATSPGQAAIALSPVDVERVGLVLARGKLHFAVRSPADTRGDEPLGRASLATLRSPRAEALRRVRRKLIEESPVVASPVTRRVPAAGLRGLSLTATGGRLAKAGDRLDLVVSLPDSQARADLSFAVLENLRVLSGGDPDHLDRLVIEVLPDEAGLALAAAGHGRLLAALRHPGDTSSEVGRKPTDLHLTLSGHRPEDLRGSVQTIELSDPAAPSRASGSP
jgi:Flp pilus assembly protein CpaB